MVKGFDPRILICANCKEEFILTADAQEYMATRGKKDDPRWCRSCYVRMKKAQRESRTRLPTVSTE